MGFLARCAIGLVPVAVLFVSCFGLMRTGVVHPLLLGGLVGGSFRPSRSREGKFRLTPLPGNRTLLEGTSWYRHGLWPAQYWRSWSDAIVHRIHLRVFREIKRLAERS